MKQPLIPFWTVLGMRIEATTESAWTVIRTVVAAARIPDVDATRIPMFLRNFLIWEFRSPPPPRCCADSNVLEEFLDLGISISSSSLLRGFQCSPDLKLEFNDKIDYLFLFNWQNNQVGSAQAKGTSHISVTSCWVFKNQNRKVKELEWEMWRTGWGGSTG